MKTNNKKIKDLLSSKFSRNTKLHIIISSLSFALTLLFSILAFVYARLNMGLAIFFFFSAILFVLFSFILLVYLVFVG